MDTATQAIRDAFPEASHLTPAFLASAGTAALRDAFRIYTGRSPDFSRWPALSKIEGLRTACERLHSLVTGAANPESARLAVAAWWADAAANRDRLPGETASATAAHEGKTETTESDDAARERATREAARANAERAAASAATAQRATRDATVPVAPVARPVDPSDTAHALEVLRGVLGGGRDTATAAEVAALVERVKALEARDRDGVTVVRVDTVAGAGAAVVTGSKAIQHPNFPLLLRTATARDNRGCRLNAWLYGPPGTGKSHAAEAIAKALGLAFYPVPPLDAPFEVRGYTDAMGRTVETMIVRAWRNGGVLLLDEAGASYAQAMLAFNGALSNGCLMVPGEADPVWRHPDCFVMVGNNDKGTGSGYAGLGVINDAFRDRFAFIEWDTCEKMERALTRVGAWCKRVQSARRYAKERGLTVMITPRASYNGSAFLIAGVDVDTCDRMTWARDLTPDQYEAARSVLPTWDAASAAADCAKHGGPAVTLATDGEAA